MLPSPDVEQPLDTVHVGLHKLESRSSASLPVAEEGTGTGKAHLLQGHVGVSTCMCVCVSTQACVANSHVDLRTLPHVEGFQMYFLQVSLNLSTWKVMSVWWTCICRFACPSIGLHAWRGRYVVSHIWGGMCFCTYTDLSERYADIGLRDTKQK